MSDSKRQKSWSGCIGCRLRRKKCDEQKPACAGCRRNGLLCTWPEAGNLEHRQILRRTNPTKRHGARTDAVTAMVVASAVASSPDADSRNALSMETMDIVRSFSSWEGSIGLNHPLLRSRESQNILEHYMCKTSKALATFHSGDTPFLTELVPVAMTSQPVLNAILASSGIHHAQFTRTPVSDATWVHYGQAIQGQKEALTQLASGKQQDVVPLLVAAILLCIVETFRLGSGAVALHHLKAARTLLRQAVQLPARRLSTGLKAFLIERYVYMVTVAHVTIGSEADSWILNDASMLCDLLYSGSGSGDLTSGMHGLFKLIPLIAIFAQNQRRISASLHASHEAIGQYKTLYNTITSWMPQSDDLIQQSCGVLYQQALLAYLASSVGEDTVIDGLESPRLVIERSFAAIQEIVSLPTANRAVLTMLCWPLAILGSCAQSQSQKQWISEQFVFLANMYASESLTDTLRLLQKLWDGEDAQSQGPSRFTELMKQENTPVLFF